MIYNIIVVVFSIICPFIILRKDFKKEESIKLFLYNNRITIILYLIFIIGFSVRLIGIVNHPNGLNTDEASIGYEAYSVSTYGIDRNGNSWPVFLESWGSGQNALYMYIIMPFVRIMGLNILSVRFPMAIIGCISLYVVYKLLKQSNDKRIHIVGLFFLAITPWHIMKSRYGLESNIFPDFILYANYFIISALNEKKEYKMYIGAVFAGLCSYAYGTSYLFLPVFVIMLLIVLLKRKDINLKTAIIFFLIVALIALPIVLMIAINSFQWQQIKIGLITIPKTEENRYENLTLLSHRNSILQVMMSNFIQTIRILVIQQDGFNINALPFFGTVYIFSLFFIIIGVIESFSNYNKTNSIFNIWFLSTILLSLFCEPNINRINIMWFPIIYYCILGMNLIIGLLDKKKIIIIALYIILFIDFLVAYYNSDFTKTYTVVSGVENIIKATKDIDVDTIYFEYAFKEPQIYICFYNHFNTLEYVQTVKYQDNIKTFGSVREFGKYIFWSDIDELNNNENGCYVMRKDKLSNLNVDVNVWKITYIDDFCLLEKII